MLSERIILSLGPTCRAGYQIRRHFGKYSCTASLFDRQVTPPAALIEYLSRDFRGMFEREDLELRGDNVVNWRYGTVHMHEFAGDIDEGYAEARKNHDGLCNVMRAALRSSAPLLLVVAGNPRDGWVNVVHNLIGKYRSAGAELLVVDDPTSIEKSVWKGNDALWSEAFRSIQPRTLRSVLDHHGSLMVKRLRRHIRKLAH